MGVVEKREVKERDGERESEKREMERANTREV